MHKPTAFSAQNSQYGSTGVGFQIRNDLYPSITAVYGKILSQARALTSAYTCMTYFSSGIDLKNGIRVRFQYVTNTPDKPLDYRSCIVTATSQRPYKNKTNTLLRPHSDLTKTKQILYCDTVDP